MNEANPPTRAIQMVVICKDSNGSPDAYLTSATVTHDQYMLGEHYEKATAEAEQKGYEEPFVVIDANERLFKKLAPIFASLSVPAAKTLSADGTADAEQATSTGTARPFYRTRYEVVVLSQESVDDDVREQVEQVIQESNAKTSFAYMKPGDEEQLSGAQMAHELTDMVGSPEQFGLAADGHDIPDHPEVMAYDEDADFPVT